ncbi:hypothetical protein DPQ22_06795 [Candidatus Tokpelaia sp.]|nr:hypothetical protein DPQ22_06795 [Candidatus Tokpelaia sp.]
MSRAKYSQTAAIIELRPVVKGIIAALQTAGARVSCTKYVKPQLFLLFVRGRGSKGGRELRELQ